MSEDDDLSEEEVEDERKKLKDLPSTWDILTDKKKKDD